SEHEATARASYFAHSIRRVKVGDRFTSGGGGYVLAWPVHRRLPEPPPLILIQHRETGQVLERLPAPLDGQGLHFDRMKLRGADLSRARLRGALLCGADLRGAILTEADLHEAIWRGGAVTARRPPDLDLLPGLQASGGSPGRTSDRACRQQHRRQRDADHRSAGDRTGRPVLPAPAADLAAGREACELLPSRRTMVGPRRAIGRRVDAPLSRVL